MNALGSPEHAVLERPWHLRRRGPRNYFPDRRFKELASRERSFGMNKEERRLRLIEMLEQIESFTRYDEPSPGEADQWMYADTVSDLPSGGTKTFASWISKRHYWEWHKLRFPESYRDKS